MFSKERVPPGSKGTTLWKSSEGKTPEVSGKSTTATTQELDRRIKAVERVSHIHLILFSFLLLFIIRNCNEGVQSFRPFFSLKRKQKFVIFISLFQRPMSLRITHPILS
jgi:hypothetical protein